MLYEAQGPAVLSQNSMFAILYTLEMVVADLVKSRAPIAPKCQSFLDYLVAQIANNRAQDDPMGGSRRALTL